MRHVVITITVIFVACSITAGEDLFLIPKGVRTRWISFENATGEPGAGGKANEGRKGAPAREIGAGETVVLADLEGPGVIRRIWCTVRGRQEALRGLVIRMYWERQKEASVEAPLQDFFGIPFARQVRFESALFSNPEGRSFNCFIPMPFRTRALITLENQSPQSVGQFFFDIDCTMGDPLPQDLALFHARYRRENPTTPKKDFEVLPAVKGRGRFLGCNVGVRPVGSYGRPFWFGEGELKIYLDGDTEYPTLVGTGTEDLVGSAWGLGKFSHLYQGCLLSDGEDGVWGFYRYHVPDPVYFSRTVRVTLQQMAGGTVGQLARLSPADYPELVSTHRLFDPATYSRPRDDGRWENFEAPQDVCATAYWYQTLPSPQLPALEPYSIRMRDLGTKPK